MLAERNVQRLNFLVAQLLQLSRIYYLPDESKQLKSLSDIAEVIAVSFNSISCSRQIQLTSHIEVNIGVSSIANSLETIIINLLSNAFKYTNQNGKVLLMLSAQNSMATLSVKDNGIGISEENIHKIFDRFTRIETQSNKKIEGVGIGLALVKQLVESHNGTIVVNSMEDKGSEFIVQLPCCILLEKESNQPEIQLDHESNKHLNYLENLLNEKLEVNIEDSESAIKETESTKDQHPKLLIIDDTKDMRTYLGTLLVPHYQCRFASDGETGVEIAQEEIPDIIISDVMMPGISGIEVLDQLRGDIRTSHIPILLLTAKGDKESKLLGLSKLADDYITKPFDADELLVRLQSILIIRKLQQKQLSQLQAENQLNEKAIEQSVLSPKELDFLERFNSIIDKEYGDETFSVEKLSSQLFLSERVLLNKTKALLGKSPSEAIREYRLNKAKQRILVENINTTQLAYDVGFSNGSYFSRCFKAYVGCTPKVYIQQHRG